MNGKNSYTIPISTAVGVYNKLSGAWVMCSHWKNVSSKPPERKMIIQANMRMMKFVQNGNNIRNNSSERCLAGARAKK